MQSCDLSFIIINWNTRQMLLECIDSVERHAENLHYEIIVVDNASADGSVEAVRARFPQVQVMQNESNLGFAKANNRALKIMRGKYAVLLNSDTLIMPGSIQILHGFMEKTPGSGMCGPQLLNSDGSFQKSFDRFPTLPGEFTSRTLIRLLAPEYYRRQFLDKDAKAVGPAKVDFIIGACMFVRKEAIAKTGMLDEEYFFFYEEIDWCFRMRRAGWTVHHVPAARIVHFGGGSTRGLNLKARTESWRSRYLFFRKNLVSGRSGSLLLYALGAVQLFLRFIGYLVANLLVLFSLPRLRNRFMIFGYLLLWHLRGLPDSMCLSGVNR